MLCKLFKVPEDFGPLAFQSPPKSPPLSGQGAWVEQSFNLGGRQRAAAETVSNVDD